MCHFELASVYLQEIPGSGIVGLMYSAFVLPIYLTNPPKDSYHVTGQQQPVTDSPTYRTCGQTFLVSARVGDQ